MICENYPGLSGRELNDRVIDRIIDMCCVLPATTVRLDDNDDASSQESLPVNDCVIVDECPHDTERSAGKVSYFTDDKMMVPSSDAVHLWKSPIVYNSQFNIAVKVLQAFERLGALRPERKYNYLNVLVIGPTFVRLAAQTRGDVKEWLGERGLGTTNFVGDCAILAAHALAGSKEVLNFSERRQKDRVLSIIIHDEAHWGIKKEGMINRFLGDNFSDSTLLLGVTATNAVFREVPKLNLETLDWLKMAREDPAH